MELRDLIGVLTRRLWLLIAGTVIAMVGSYFAFRFLIPWPGYQATTMVIIGNNLKSDWASLQVSRELAPTYARWATRRPVLEGVIDTLSLRLSAEELRERIDVRVVDDMQLIEISATSSDPQQAAAMANEVVRQLEAQIAATSTDEDALPSPSKEEIVRLQARISAAEAGLISLSDALANYRPASPWASDITRLEARISDTEAKLVALTDQLLETDSTTEADVLTRHINMLQSNLGMWRGELDRLYARAESDSEAQISQLVRRINVLQSNLGIWQREYSDLKAEYTNRPVPLLVTVEDAQAPAHAANPPVNILVAAMTGLVLTTGLVFMVELSSKEQPLHGLGARGRRPERITQSGVDGVASEQVEESAVAAFVHSDEGERHS